MILRSERSFSNFQIVFSTPSVSSHTVVVFAEFWLRVPYLAPLEIDFAAAEIRHMLDTYVVYIIEEPGTS